LRSFVKTQTIIFSTFLTPVGGFRKILFAVHCVLQKVVDQSDGCGAKFSIVVVSDLFQGKPLLLRHR